MAHKGHILILCGHFLHYLSIHAPVFTWGLSKLLDKSQFATHNPIETWSASTSKGKGIPLQTSKFSTWPSVIEPATSRLVAQSLKQLCHRVSDLTIAKSWFSTESTCLKFQSRKTSKVEVRKACLKRNGSVKRKVWTCATRTLTQLCSKRIQIRGHSTYRAHVFWSYNLFLVSFRDREASIKRRPCPTGDCCAKGEKTLIRYTPTDT